ncbi:MAG: NAD(P)/FAD-dependent oxidoreductase, partial [Actinomycetota bacterium]
MGTAFDMIVVGARVAGAPTAMLLARLGYRVLVVDRAQFPSDTMSGHFVHPPGVAALERWGLANDLARTGCPPIREYRFDFGPVALRGVPHPAEGTATAYGPRRTVLDTLLVDAAARAGAEIRERFFVDDLLRDDGRVSGIRGHDEHGRPVEERAAIVVGADGAHSPVARLVDAPFTLARPTLSATYYTYWSGVPTDGFEVYIRPWRSWGAVPTHDGLTMLAISWPADEFGAVRRDVEGAYLGALDLAPAFAERVRGGRREARFVGTGSLPNFFRRPYGPGWALVGDAGYHKDPCTAQGISDAFRDAELLSRAIDAYLGDGRPYEAAMAAYEQARDHAARPLFDLTCDLATQTPAPPELQRLIGAAAGDQAASDDFVSVLAGTLSPAAFFAPANVERLLQG